MALAWLALKSAAVDALRVNPVLAAALSPDDPRVVAALAMADFRARRGELRPASREAVTQSALEAPLAAEPFYLNAIAALLEKDSARAERLLLEARKRDPRSRITRLLLLDHYLRTDRIDEAAAEISALNRLIPRASPLLVGELARLVQQPETGPPLVRALQKDPALRDSVLEKLAGSGGDVALILRMATGPAATGVTPGESPWQRRLIASLVERGDVAHAYQLWRSFAGGKPPARKEGVYDGRFRGLPGTEPFNWSFPTTAAGAAERTSRGGLEVNFYGRADGELASQLLVLTPGRYRLRVRAEGNADGEGSSLNWTITCLGSKAPAADIALRNVTYTPKLFTTEFIISPSTCTAQWLRLVGTSGEFVNAQNVTISGIEIKPIGLK
jgi:hypothetical protein